MRPLIATSDEDNGEGMAGTDRWMVSYADFITLLFVLFLALYARLPRLTEPGTAPPDKQPAHSARDIRLPAAPIESQLPAPRPAETQLPTPAPAPVAQTAVAQSAVATAPAGPAEPARPLAAEIPRPAPPAAQAPDPRAASPIYPTDEPRPVATAPQEPMPAPQAKPTAPLAQATPAAPTSMDRLSQSLADLRGSGSIAVSPRGNGWVIDIADSTLFASGTAQPAPGAQATLARIAEAVGASKGRIIVEGHTDNQMIKNSQFPSNWELSSARAAAVARALQERGISADRLTASGLAQTRPRASNESEQGRRENRRVSIILLGPAN
jgi:chemotaxis protein MotB